MTTPSTAETLNNLPSGNPAKDELGADISPLGLLVKFESFATLHQTGDQGLPLVTLSVSGFNDSTAAAPQVMGRKCGFRRRSRFLRQHQGQQLIDGTIEIDQEALPDGSTRETRYYQPVDLNRAAIGQPPVMTMRIRQSELVVSPDGSTTYASFSPDGGLEILEGTNAYGDVSTFTRQEDGLFEGATTNLDGTVTKASFAQFRDNFLRVMMAEKNK
jgi:hypothetical protein